MCSECQKWSDSQLPEIAKTVKWQLVKERKDVLKLVRGLGVIIIHALIIQCPCVTGWLSLEAGECSAWCSHVFLPMDSLKPLYGR